MNDQSMALPPLTPLLFAVRARLAAPPAIETVAETRELCPAEDQRCPPATVLEGRAERLRDFEFDSERERVRASLGGGLMHHGPTLAHTIRNAKLLAGSVYAQGARLYLRPLKESYPGPAPIALDRAALCTAATGDKYFGHFMTEDAPQTMIAGEFGGAFRLPDRNWAHLPVYREALELDWRQVAAAHVRELSFFTDFAQNALRRARYRELRSRLRKHIAPRQPGARVYLRRGATGVDGPLRSPRNEPTIAAALSARGFDILALASTPPAELVARLLDAKILVSVEGSQLIHGVYTLADDGAACILMAPMRPVIQMKDRFDALELPTAIVVGEDHGDAFSIDIGDLERTLDLLEARLARAASSVIPAER